MNKINYRYFLSDIHGCYDSMLETLGLVNMEDEEIEVYFLGDYMDMGPDSAKVLYFLKALQNKYPNRVNVLPGNHEEFFIKWLYAKDEMISLSHLPPKETVNSFIGEMEADGVKPQVNEHLDTKVYHEILKNKVKGSHGCLLNWLRKIAKVKYIETDEQIILHAGIMEIEGENELWKILTPEDYFIHKFPADTGPFFKDIIAGHVSSRSVAENKKYLGKVYFDGQSHFYIDGETPVSQIVPLLKYRISTKSYSSFEQTIQGNKTIWKEYIIKK